MSLILLLVKLFYNLEIYRGIYRRISLILPITTYVAGEKRNTSRDNDVGRMCVSRTV